MDVTDIEAGVDFVEVLERAVGSCDVLLAVIGPEWISATDRSGRRRLDDPQDFIRLEIGAALKRNVRVIPVLVQGAVMPRVEELPPDLGTLVRRQAVELRDIHWNADVEDLTAALARVLLPELNSPPRPTGRSRGLIAVGSLGAVAAAIAIGIATRENWMRFVPAVEPSGAVVGEGTRSAPPPPSPAPTAPAVRELASDESAKGETPSDAPATEAPAVPESERAPPGESPPRSKPTHVTPPRPEAKSPSPPIASGTTLDVARFGMKVADAVDTLTRTARAGAIVTDVKHGGAAEEAGIRDGDLIVEVNGTRIAHRDDLARLAAGIGVTGQVVVRLMRDNAGRTIEMTVVEPAKADTARPPTSAPNVVGLSSAAAREALSKAGFGIGVKYVESKSNQALVEAQSPPTVDAQKRRVVEVQVGLRASLYVYYTGTDAKVADDLAAHLRESFGERLALVRSIERSQSEMTEGDMPFGGAGFEGVAMLVARAASARLSQMFRRQIILRPKLNERIRPGTLRILVLGRDAASTGGTPSDRPATAPDVVGQPLTAARELLTRAGFDVGHKYVEGKGARREDRGVVNAQRVSERSGRRGLPLVLLDVVATATVAIYYARDDEQQVADELAQYLRQWLANPQYVIKTVKSGRADTQRGQVHHSTDLDALAVRILSGAGPWLSRRLGSDARLRRELQARMVPTVVVLTLPDSTASQRP